jgi:hypothetical protein
MQLINMPKFGVLFTIKVSILYKQKNKNISVCTVEVHLT